MNGRHWALVSLLAAASCTVGPDYVRPAFFDDGQLTAALDAGSGESFPISVRWYRQFEDETLNGLVGRALAGSPNVQIAVQKLKQARYTLMINEAEFLPRLNADGGYDYNYLANGKNLPRTVEDYYKAGLDASWEIDIWGGGRRLNEESRALMRAAADNLVNVMLSMTAETASDYIGLKTAQEQLRITKENLRLQQDIYQTVKEKYDNGLADDAALNQAEFAVQTTKALLPALEQQEESYKNALAVLLGVLPGSLTGLDDDGDNLIGRPFFFHVKNLYNFPLAAVRNRPDVRMAENALIAKNAAIGQAVAELFPNVSIGGVLGWQAKHFSGLGSSSAAAYGFTPAVSLPLFNFGQLINQVKLNREVKEEYVYLYKNTLLGAVEEVKNATVAVRKEYERYQALSKSVRNMQRVLSSMRDKYREGLIEFSDMLTTEQNLLTAQNNLAASGGTVYRNIITFYKAVGGGY